jgi:hypothetical protein
VTVPSRHYLPLVSRADVTVAARRYLPLVSR